MVALALLAGNAHAAVIHPDEDAPLRPLGHVPEARLDLLKKGMNMHGWFQGAREFAPTPAELAELRAMGITHLRIPLDPALFLERLAGPRRATRMLRLLDQSVQSATDRGFSVSLDFHPGAAYNSWYRSNPARGVTEVTNFWVGLATHYAASNPERVFFEIYNEVGVSGARWQQDVRQIVQSVRAVAPQHTLIVGPGNYQSVGALENFPPLADGNIVYAVHFYAPMVFTSQGAGWMRTKAYQYVRNLPFPADPENPALKALLAKLEKTGQTDAQAIVQTYLENNWNAEKVAAEIDRAAAWSKQHRRPVIINEFGVLRGRVGAADMARWIGAVRTAAEEADMGWALWDFASTFGLYAEQPEGTREADPVMVEALGLRIP